MMPETFFDNFELLAEAPNGVQKLREMLLQLAVRGKLVVQEEGDEPALILLEKIKFEKEQLSKSRGINTQKKSPEISESEMLFDLPVGWAWCHLNDFGMVFNGNSLNSDEKNIYSKAKEGLPYIATKDVGYGSLDVNYDNGVIIPFLEPRFKVAHANSILICSEGGSAGKKIGLINRDVCFGNKLLAIETFDGIFPKYVFYLCQSRFFKSLFNEKMKGIIGGISLFNFLSLVVPLPPLNEQRRIIAKVDHLMSICDELEARQQKKRESRARLNNAALDRLLATRAPEEFEQGWRYVCDNFDMLYDTPENIVVLRQSILQLAVMGKLVPQEPNDEPSRILLGKINAEKAKLNETNKIKKNESLALISDDKPFNIPRNWQWVRFGDICLGIEAGWSPMCDSIPAAPGEWGILKVSSVSWNQFKSEENKRLLSGQEPKPEFEVMKGDFLMSRANTSELVAKSVVIEKEVSRLMMSDKVLRARFADGVFSNFVNLVNNSRYARDYYAKVATGTSSSMKNVTRAQIRNLLIPLPPSAEQRRIVAKVNQLMSLCDALEAGLARSQADSEKLMEAVVGRMLAR